MNPLEYFLWGAAEELIQRWPRVNENWLIDTKAYAVAMRCSRLSVQQSQAEREAAQARMRAISPVWYW